MNIKFYSGYSKNYGKLLVENSEGVIVACLYINKTDGTIECDSWIRN